MTCSFKPNIHTSTWSKLQANKNFYLFSKHSLTDPSNICPGSTGPKNAVRCLAKTARQMEPSTTNELEDQLRRHRIPWDKRSRVGSGCSWSPGKGDGFHVRKNQVTIFLRRSRSVGSGASHLFCSWTPSTLCYSRGRFGVNYFSLTKWGGVLYFLWPFDLLN